MHHCMKCTILQKRGEGRFEMISVLLELSKYRISLFYTLCAGAGFIFSEGPALLPLLSLALAVLMTAGGALVLNQYQERAIDALMARTAKRPLPSGRCTLQGALILALLLISGGLATAFLCFGTITTLLCVSSLVLYNGIYTPLKKISILAVIPGMLIGAMAPLIGWTAAGGAAGERETVLLMCFILMWQLPHFWLHMLRHGDDCARAGLPSITSVFSREQISRILFIWINATGTLCLLIPFFISVPVSLYLAILLLTVMLLVASLGVFAIEKRDESLSMASSAVNVYALSVVVMIFVGRAGSFFW